MNMFVLVCALAGVLSTQAIARLQMEKEFTCPLTGTRFTADVEVSGTTYCSRLDFKPVGPIGAPPVEPDCPDDGFVLYKKEFTEYELDRVREWMATPGYKAIIRKESTYYRRAGMMELLGEPLTDVAWSYVNASWEVESKPQKYREYLEMALEKFQLVTQQDPEDHGAWYMQANILRRLGEFGQAMTIIDRLTSISEGQLRMNRKVLQELQRQTKLRNAGPAYIGGKSCE